MRKHNYEFCLSDLYGFSTVQGAQFAKTYKMLREPNCKHRINFLLFANAQFRLVLKSKKLQKT